MLNLKKVKRVSKNIRELINNYELNNKGCQSVFI